MTRDASTLTTEQSSPTQHAMLIAWGHFGRTLEFTKRLAGIPIDQKAVIRAPHEKIAAFGIGLLSGRLLPRSDSMCKRLANCTHRLPEAIDMEVHHYGKPQGTCRYSSSGRRTYRATNFALCRWS